MLFQLYGYALSAEQIDSLYPYSSVNVENVLTQGFHLFPNPSTGKITIESPNNKIIQAVTVTDIMGKRLYHQLSDQATVTAIELNLESISNKGRQLYIVAVRIEDQVLYKKLILN